MSFSNTIIAYKILKDLSSPYEEMDAFKLGIIDDKGAKLKSPQTTQERDAYDSYTKMILNMRRLMQRFVGTNPTVNKLVSLLLLKEGVEQHTVDVVIRELDLPSDTQTISDLQAKTLVESVCIH